MLVRTIDDLNKQTNQTAGAYSSCLGKERCIILTFKRSYDAAKFECIVTYTSGARERPLSKQLYNNAVNNGRY
jgi:hypothetical protein